MYDPSDTFDLKVIERFLKSHQIIPDISVWYKVIGQPNDTDRQAPLTWANKNAMIICDDSIKIFQLFNYKSHWKELLSISEKRCHWTLALGHDLWRSAEAAESSLHHWKHCGWGLKPNYSRAGRDLSVLKTRPEPNCAVTGEFRMKGTQ